MSRRQFMQLLGTEFGLQRIGEDLWDEELRSLALEGFGDLLVVADDVRYANEVDAIHRHGAIVIRIDREGAGSAAGAAHSSEAMAFEPDLVIRNQGSEEAFGEDVADAIADYAWA